MSRLGFIFLVSISFNSFSQDSLVRLSEIKYTSPLEELRLKESFNNENPSYVSLFLTLDPNMSKEKEEEVSSEIQALIENSKNSQLQNKKPHKQVKIVYDKTHDAFLKKYELENSFHEIFLNGNYNCVTATALYAIIFEGLRIPYVIKEEPTHVYLVAYPDINNILVETTTPVSGFLNFDQAFKNNFVNKLKDQKLIGSTESSNYSTEQLFNKYYFSQEDIDLKKLIGIHYMNDAIFNKEHGSTRKALEQAEKAYLFYPSERCQYLIASFGIELLNDSEIKPLEKALLISKLSRYKKMGITNDMIKGEFSRLTYQVMSEQNNKQLYTECYRIFSTGAEDIELKKDISYIYHHENGRIYYNQGNYEDARNFFREALKLQPNNVDLGLIFSQSLANTLITENSSEVILDTLEMYKKSFPSLMEIQKFKSMVATSYLLEFHNYYSKGNAVAGDKYKEQFENLFTEIARSSVNPDVIGMAYSTACTYYFKKGMKSKAKQYATRGLELAPGNYELRVRQQMLSR